MIKKFLFLIICIFTTVFTFINISPIQVLGSPESSGEVIIENGMKYYSSKIFDFETNKNIIYDTSKHVKFYIEDDDASDNYFMETFSSSVGSYSSKTSHFPIVLPDVEIDTTGVDSLLMFFTTPKRPREEVINNNNLIFIYISPFFFIKVLRIIKFLRLFII